MAMYQTSSGLSNSSSTLSNYSTDGASSYEARPGLARRETEQLLDYYQSPEADTGRPYLGQSLNESSKDNVPASLFTTNRKSSPEVPPKDIRRRSSVRTIAGADNRRLAIVELDASPPSSDVTSASEYPFQESRNASSSHVPSHSHPDSSTLLSRRGHDHARLALVAPPDASPSSYANLSPPIPQSAPVNRNYLSSGPSGYSSQYGGDVEDEQINKYHRRTRSSTAEQRTQRSIGKGTKGPLASPRDVGIVGTTSFSGVSNALASSSSNKYSKLKGGSSAVTESYRSQVATSAATISSTLPTTTGSLAPVFQTPRLHSPSASPLPSRSPSPIKSQQTSPYSGQTGLFPMLTQASASGDSILVTPNIGEEKDPMTKVAGPVVVDLIVDDAGRAVGTRADSNDDTLKSRRPQLLQQPPFKEVQADTRPAPIKTSSMSSLRISSPPPPRPPRRHSPSTVALNRRKDGLTVTMQPFQASPASPTMTPSGSASTGMIRTESDYSIVAVSVSSSEEKIFSKNEKTPSPLTTHSVTETVSHRREGAFPPSLSDRSTPTSDGFVHDVSTSGRDDGAAEHLHPPRPILTSRWSSDGAPEPKPSSDLLADSGSMDVSTPQTDPATDNIGSAKSSDVSPVTKPLRETKNALYHNTNTHINQPADTSTGGMLNGRGGSKSTSKENDADVVVTVAPNPHSKGRPTSLSTTTSKPPTDLPLGGVEPSKKASTRDSQSPRSSVSSKAHKRRSSRMSRRLSADKPKGSPEDSQRAYSPTSPAVPSFRDFTPPELPSPPPPLPSSKANRYSALPRTSSAKGLARMSMVQQRAAPSSAPYSHHADDNSLLDTTPTKPKRPKTKRDAYGWPEAMSFGDVLKKKTPLERAIGYARKMKELEEEDCGLGGWIEYAKYGSTPLQGKGSPLMPTNGVRSAPHARVASHGSTMTDVTFPKRRDAYLATDLSHRPPGEPTTYGPPANVPYPGLLPGNSIRHVATSRTFGVGVSTSIRNMATPHLIPISPKTPDSGKSGGGFFASIGRRASIRRERPTLTPPQSAPSQPSLARVSTRATQNSVATGTSSVVGGPRPNPSNMARTKRSNSVLDIARSPATETQISPRSTKSALDTDDQYETNAESVDTDASNAGNYVHTSISDRSGLANSAPPIASLPRSSVSYRSPTARPDANAMFNTNLGKLVDLLPHVERSILEAYLRQAGGEDMRAIGAYLEDEKNGCVIRV